MAFLVVRKFQKPRSERHTDLDAFLKWLEGHHRQGKIILSGPANNYAAAVFLVMAGDRGEVDKIMAGDPMHQAGESNYEVYDWDIHQALGGGAFTAAAVKAAS
jgi:uncharacterized protein YciI